MRCVEMHDCPACENPATATFAAAVAQSLGESTIKGAFEPSSSRTFLRAALAAIAQPTSADPVKVMYATSSWVASASPTTDPEPVTTFSQPAGTPRPCSNSASNSDDNGVCDAGFSTTGQPAAIAGANLWATRLSGKLKGEIAATTPTGTRRVKLVLPAPAAVASIGTTSPANVRACAAANANVSTARAASTRAVLSGLAASCAMALAK